ncbi:AcrR family transcriptional regulator [Nocardia transvalensis]|uniref:AcrR family transcriptional regulator n=1 Tax=Nocardia transvalensis TaxID=37333 RepID=A0A7W9PJT3_9NOCA|nr:TetR family transcriptional regulator [Nocardia transvalensis]MBB5917486.1 AcrR family transcriptional regulator [Nocardia transvalensis]
MSRWEPNGRDRLAQAALELYAERGFDQTTVAEIAERAGLTERTFFRHFADKREVLFGGQNVLSDAMAGVIDEADESVSPIDAVAAALHAVAAVVGQRPDFSRQRQALIDSHPGLRERELIKLATLTEATVAALRRRGVGEPAASLAAEAGIAVFKIAYERWITLPGAHDLSYYIQESIDELKAVTAG